MTAPVEVPTLLAFPVTVAAVQRLSPSYLRITFRGADLAQFHRGGPLGTRDLRVKVIVPGELGDPWAPLDLSPGWYPRWLATDPRVRGCMRTYTVRGLRLDLPVPELDLDFVLHLDADGHGGPATQWAAAAAVGDPITILGPNQATGGVLGGIEWHPPRASEEHPVRVLLAGDETAVPAVTSVLATLPAGYHGQAILEVPCAEDTFAVTTPSQVEVVWLPRDGRPHGAALATAVRAALADVPPATASRDAPPADVLPEVDIDRDILWEAANDEDGSSSFYAWIAGEAATVRDLRRHLVRDLGVDRTDVAFMGYWRLGRAEGS
ncbi:siderophore-interacting protein [Rhodococcus sp. X156]|uniref:siderophore-interacting protein n=1 Tax=Rhodococcus sp. X156 TaxID=2499145 RepID=UPI000FD6BF1C|nr:siderophore-interacting protein [Rhodococcus sp. X156]